MRNKYLQQTTAARLASSKRPGAPISKPAQRHTFNPTTLQLSGVAISSVFSPCPPPKNTTRHFLSIVVDEQSVERSWQLLQDLVTQRSHVARPVLVEPGETKAIELGARIIGVKNHKTALSMLYGGDPAVMEEELAKIPPCLVQAGVLQTVAMFDFTEAHSMLKQWDNLFPVCDFSNAHGNTYKPADGAYEQRTEFRVMFISINVAESKIPVHLRCPWDPKTGYLGDYTVPKFLSDTTTQYSKGFPVAYWCSSDHRSGSLESVMEKYTPYPGSREVLHQLVSLEGSPSFVRNKLSEKDPQSGRHTWMEIQLLRVEGPRQPEEGADFDPNTCSDACFHLDLRFPREVVSKALGITNLAKFYWFMSVHKVPGYMWVKLNPKKTIEANIASPIVTTGRPNRVPFTADPETGTLAGKASHGTLVGFVEHYAPALGLYLEQNGIPVTITTAKKALPARRELPDAGPLSAMNPSGIAVISEWTLEDDTGALNAGRPGAIDPEVRYFALAVRVVEDPSPDAPAGSVVPCTWTLEELESFSNMTAEEGDQYLARERDVRYYVYAVAPSARRTELTRDEAVVMGPKAFRGDRCPVLYADEPVADETNAEDERMGIDAEAAAEPSRDKEEADPVVPEPAPPGDTDDESEEEETLPSGDEEAPKSKSAAKEAGKRGRAAKGHPASIRKKKQPKGQ